MGAKTNDYGNGDPAFLRYYAAVLTREADARPGSDCQWMRDGAERALRRADDLSTPTQGDLFARIQKGPSDAR